MPPTPDAAPEITDAWILQRRPAKNRVDPRRPYAHLVEPERTAAGRVEDVATLFLTNRECPFRCLMCDLWKNTTDHPVAPGDIPRQVRWALDRLPPARHIKLYNSGNFFDPRAVPPSDDPAIAALVSSFDTVIVESHPRMVGRRCFDFSERIAARLEVAVGLETVHPGVLAALNKRMTTSDFADYAAKLTDRGIGVRAFILLRPPFMTESEGVTWARRSIDFAFDVGVECCTIIPTRAGNGALDDLARSGHFHPPALESLEDVLTYGVSLQRGRVFADLWDVEKLADALPQPPSADRPHRACESRPRRDVTARIRRLHRINLTQSVAADTDTSAGVAAVPPAGTGPGGDGHVS